MRDIISLNSTNYIGNNLYRIRLPKATQYKKGDQISLYSFSMYNSFYNISASQYQNTSISVNWLGTIYNWTIPDGYYSVSDLDIWLQSQFILNKLYCTNSTNSQNIFFVRFLTNSVLYKNEIDVFYIPSATNASSFGYVIPSNASWVFPSSNTMITLTINQNLQKYFGITDRLIFGDGTVENRYYVSNVCPTVSPVFSIFIGCSLISSNFNQIGNLMAQLPISSSFGNLIRFNSTMDSNIDINPGIYSEIIVTLWDQENNPLKFQDTDVTIFFIVNISE